jgi:hypothetical protein
VKSDSQKAFHSWIPYTNKYKSLWGINLAQEPVAILCNMVSQSKQHIGKKFLSLGMDYDFILNLWNMGLHDYISFSTYMFIYISKHNIR